MSKKSKTTKLSPGKDDLLHVWGNAYAGLLLYKAATVILAGVVIALSISVVILAQKAKDVKPMPIFIDRNTGIAEPVAFELIDAAGEKRHETEVTSQAWAAIKETLLRDRRMEMVDQDNQGLVEIKLLVIQSVEPEIAIQITFKKILIMAGSNRQETEHVGIIKLHTVKRHEGNAHGLMVVEYRESKND